MVLLLYRMAGEPNVSGVSNPFTDVAPTAYYHDAVLWGVSNGYVKGTTDKTFSPEEYIKRGDMVLLLHRMEEKPTASTTNPFTDVSTSDYYYNAIQWAYANNIVKGVTSTSFAPTDNIRRCDMVLLLYRANAK